jgi:hypothetical protein
MTRVQEAIELETVHAGFSIHMEAEVEMGNWNNLFFWEDNSVVFDNM